MTPAPDATADPALPKECTGLVLTVIDGLDFADSVVVRVPLTHLPRVPHEKLRQAQRACALIEPNVFRWSKGSGEYGDFGIPTPYCAKLAVEYVHALAHARGWPNLPGTRDVIGYMMAMNAAYAQGFNAASFQQLQREIKQGIYDQHHGVLRWMAGDAAREAARRASENAHAAAVYADWGLETP